ncbi:hypothetical protein [Staphylococcus felis]|uniref:hypothetical protein n=1 Tax=Staphylococcus felis TaxID=46127 RepID=UPI003967938F
MRGVMIDITMDTIAKKTSGHTKYINQRDKDYLNKAYIEEAERKKFTDALKEYVGVGQYKYAYFTDLLYKSQTIEFVSLQFLLNFSSSHFEANATLFDSYFLHHFATPPKVSAPNENSSERVSK